MNLMRPAPLLCLVYLISFVWGQAQTDATGLSKSKLKVAPEAIPTEIPWKIAPFLKVRSVDHFDPLYKQVYFEDYDPKSRKLRMGVADLQGNILVPAEKYEFIDSSKDMLWLKFDLDNGVMALKTKPDSTFAYPFYSPYTRDTIVIDEKTIIKQISEDSSQLLVNGEVVRYITDFISSPISDGFIHIREGIQTEYTLNKSGKVMIPKNRFSYIGGFENGYSTLARVKGKNERVLIDTVGKIIPTPAGAELSSLPFAKDKFFSFTTDAGFPQILGLINQYGQVIVKPGFEDYESDYVHVYAGKIKDQWWLYNFKSEIIMPDTFEHVDFDGKYFITCSKSKKKINLYDVQLNLLHSFDFDGYWYMPAVYVDLATKEPFVTITSSYSRSILYDRNGVAYMDGQSEFEGIIPGGVIYKKMDKFGLTALGEKRHLPPVFGAIYYLEESNTLWGKIDGKWGLLDW